MTVIHRVTLFHQNVQKLFDNTKKGKLNSAIKYFLYSARKVNYAKNINTNNIFNAIHDSSSLQQAPATELM